MSTQAIPSTVLKNNIYKILQAAHLDASELTSHRDLRVSHKGRNIKRILNQCLEYVRTIHLGASDARALAVTDGMTAYQVIARACMRDAKGAIDPKNVSIICDPTIIVQRDAAELSSILDILCRNALEAVQDRKASMVSVSMSLEGKFGKFTIEDNGPGLPMAVLDRLFPTLVDPAEDNSERPLCRGLENAIRTARSSGGRIMMMRTGPSGSKFSVRMPAENFLRSSKVTSYRPAPATEIIINPMSIDDESLELICEP